MKKIKLKSPAKLNLTLEIIQKLPNGFHKLHSVIMKVDNLFDEVAIEFNDKKENIEIVCDVKSIPIDGKNIVWKIAEKFFEKTGKKTGLRIKIKKNIPVAAGLGGGSSDGASVLLALNEYFGNPLKTGELIELASEVGKDIPFFLQKDKIAYIGGMGEKLRPIKCFSAPVVLVIKPKGEISTAEAYGELDKSLFFMNSQKRRNISAELIKKKKDVQIWSQFLYNDFEGVAKKRYIEIDILEKALISFGALGASMSGKGPTVFGIFKHKGEALAAKVQLEKYFPECSVYFG